MSSLSKKELLTLAVILELLLRDDSPMPYPGPETEKDNCNHALCTECGGKCCKNVGCTFSPQDFIKLSPEGELTPEGILNEVKKGYITLELYVDLCYVEGFIWTPRMRNIGGPIIEDQIIYRQVNGPCVALRKNGCAFSYEERPTEGKLLIPRKTNGKMNCESRYGIDQALKEWRPYQRILCEVVESVRGKNYPCTI